jgi:four helix bundle protein
MTNDQGAGPDRRPARRPATGGKNDLHERMAAFGEAVIRYAKRIRVTPITTCLIDQMVRAGTRVGANYCEADDAESKKDFRHKISICLKEVKETRHWLRMMAAAEPELRDGAAELWQEA